MNTYDPADVTLHIHMAPDPDPYSVPVESSRRLSRLPVGYADNSPRTSLRRRRRPPNGTPVPTWPRNPETPDLPPADARNSATSGFADTVA